MSRQPRQLKREDVLICLLLLPAAVIGAKSRGGVCGVRLIGPLHAYEYLNPNPTVWKGKLWEAKSQPDYMKGCWAVLL